MSFKNKNLSGITQFKQLSDVIDYVAHANEYVRVNAGANGLTYASGLSASNVFRGVEYIADQAGFVGDGVADDVAKVNAAIDSAGAYGVVVFPPKAIIGCGSKINAKYNFQTWIQNGCRIKALAGFPTSAGNDRLINIGNAGSQLLNWETYGRLYLDVNGQNIWAASNSAMSGVGGTGEWKTSLIQGWHTEPSSQFALTKKGVFEFRDWEANVILNDIRMDRVKGYTSDNRAATNADLKRCMKIYQKTNGGNFIVMNTHFSAAGDGGGAGAGCRDAIGISIAYEDAGQFDRSQIFNYGAFNNPQTGGGVNEDFGLTGLEYRFEDAGGEHNNKDHRVNIYTCEDMSVGIEAFADAPSGGEVYVSDFHWDYKEGDSNLNRREANHRAIRCQNVRMMVNETSSFFVIGDNSTAVDWYGIEVIGNKLFICKAKNFTMRRSLGNFVKIFGTAMTNDPRNVFLSGEEHIQFISGVFNTASVTRYLPINGSTNISLTSEAAVQQTLRKRGVVRGVVIKPRVNTNTNNVSLDIRVDGVTLETVTIPAGSTAQITAMFVKTIGAKTNSIDEISDTALLNYRLTFGAGTVNMEIGGSLIFEEFTEEAE